MTVPPHRMEPASGLRVGLLTPAWPGSRTANGIASAVAHLAAGLEACGHHVTIITFSVDGPHGFPRVVQIEDPRWGLFDKVRARLDGEATTHRKIGQSIASAVREAIKRHGVEIVVMEETQGWASTVSGLVPIPVVVTLHGPWWLHKAFEPQAVVENLKREARERAGLDKAAAITAPSHDALNRTKAEWGLPNVPVAVIGNPVKAPSEALVLDAERLERLLFVGRFELVKGGDIVIEAFSEIAARHPSCRLTFVGPDRGIERQGLPRLTLAEAVARLPRAVRDRIDVRGQCSRDDVADLRRTHGLAIVASRYETFGGTVAEAMAAGAGLICTDVGGVSGILTHEQTGLLVPPDDPHALADACLRLLNDPALAQRLGQAARSHVKNHLSPEVIGQQMAGFLTKLCRP